MGSHTLTTRAERNAPPENNPFGEKCGARKTDGSGGLCRNDAGYGTDHPGVGSCKHHGGSTEAGKKRAATLLAQRVVGGYHGEIDIEPHDGILWCVRMAAGEIQHINEHAALAAADQEADDPQHFASRKLQALMMERAKAMDRLAKYSKAALDANVAQRQVEIAEGYGTILAQLLGAVFKDLDLTAAQWRAAPLIAERHLMMLERGPARGGDADADSTAEEIQ